MFWKTNTKDIFWCFVLIPVKFRLWLKYSRRNSTIMFSWWFHYMVNWVLKNRKKLLPKPKNTNLSLHQESQKQPSQSMESKSSLILDGTEKCSTINKPSSHQWNWHKSVSHQPNKEQEEQVEHKKDTVSDCILNTSSKVDDSTNYQKSKTLLCRLWFWDWRH